MAELLALENVTAGYGNAVVLEDVSLTLAVGETLAVLGRNGMGKSTLLKTILGLTTLVRGELRWRGRDFRRDAVHARAGAGLGWAPQERGMFPSLSVEEHLTAVARPGAWTLERVYGLFPRLAERRLNPGHRLSGGEQQMLAIGRALVTNPALLLLDEPTEGLAPILVLGLKRTLEQLTREAGMAIVLVEQHARLALSLTRNAIVLERGRIVHRGPSASLLEDQDLLHGLLSVA
jgi:branched-chain amino acid transport system ATP-binding protein